MPLNSFVIRCWSGDPNGSRLIYVVQHVRTGEQFRSQDWGEVGRWIEAQARTADGDAHTGFPDENEEPS